MVKQKFLALALAAGAQSVSASTVCSQDGSDYVYTSGNPLTTGNVAHEKSRIRFLGVRGGIFLKMLFWENIRFFENHFYQA